VTEGIIFQVETSRVLQILAKEIYDSPLAMLRENLQNAYDAVRERFAADGELATGGRIDIKIVGNQITISDNGVGMNEAVLRQNFWNAGSSGKHSDRARKAGVVGTFGIGAMANFGVCSRLEIITRAMDGSLTLKSVAERDTLKIGEECITFTALDPEGDVGTTLTATLDSSNSILPQQAKDYLKPYVGLLPVPVFLNDDLISMQRMIDALPMQIRSFSPLGSVTLKDRGYKALFSISADSNGQVLANVTDISVTGVPIAGEMALLQGGGELMGLRSYFGLAPLPAAGNYQYGGFANLPFLQPTAGRDALTRESIEQATILISLAERASSEMLATSPLSDRSNAFLAWVAAAGRYELAKRVTILVHPREENIPLGDLDEYTGDRQRYYYLGNDKSIIGTFSGEDSYLMQVSPNQPRRRLQQLYVTSVLKIPAVPSSAQILREYKGAELELSEASILFRIAGILRDDYLIPELEVVFADISHGVSIISEQTNGLLKLYIARNSAGIAPLLEVQSKAYELFSQFMKDFVRVNVYPRVQQFVPSSTKGGVEALRKILIRSRELYRVEESDRGDLEGVLGDYLSGAASFAAVLHSARTKARPQTQRVSAEQVGTIEAEVPGLAESPVRPEAQTGQEFIAAPPIIRDNVSSDMKILTTGGKYPLLNQFTMLLGLSDRLMNTEAEFFHVPHTTRILWGGHRVVYIFTDATERLSLYYDIELRKPIDGAKTAGGMFPTTTLITRNRIFVPVPAVLQEEFQVAGGAKEFFVRFDLIVNRT
jgi:molecular chaperone HtpG